MWKNKNWSRFRGDEYAVLFYRIGLAFVMYQVCRLFFYIYNADLIEVSGVSEYFHLAYHGLAFDTTAILYLNGLFILLAVLPLPQTRTLTYQKVLKILYFVTNGVGLALNCIDFIYYRFNFGRSTSAITDSIAHESNKLLLFANFALNYWHVFILFTALLLIWIKLYGIFRLPFDKLRFTVPYFVFSLLSMLAIVILAIGGIRGDFKKSTRPINLVDANRYVRVAAQADIVLNTPFAVFRTLFANSFKKVNFVSKSEIDSLVKPYKQYKNNPKTRPNIVILILESNGKEYFGSFNKEMGIKNHISYTPFVDSLAQHSRIYTNAYANGYKSIHAMSSVLAGIPSFKDAFTSSPYPKQPTESLVSVLESLGYNTSFFHGAPNGSMGFLGYGNILGFDAYYGKNEYNNDADFDGVWGIWDEPFFQYFNKTISQFKQPFFTTLFSVSSHEPYKVPEKYEGKFPKGNVNMHQCMGYTDYALKQFFAQAKKQPWFENTIFVLVGDHGNTIFYDEYKKEANKNAVALLFYAPKYNLKGADNRWAQQIDIYPTILDLIGYDKPFRSWGRSLLSDNEISPFVIRYSSNNYMLFADGYICIFDGRKAVGFYKDTDRGLTQNLIAQRNATMNQIERRCKALIQDYMQRIMDRKLGGIGRNSIN
ncbi:LTA synthase family protein [Flavobacterium sp.]|uniref:LTA synthase family protein n=1 Tax=Flavobacterium sp. TaxID=239 RepID=UPI00261BB7BE|nr:LTA synthase family protein [Flavobacterium sp.]